MELVVLSLATIEMKEGGTAALSAVVYPADATDKSVTWSVSPEGIVSVAGGVITALHAGNCVVTATAGGKSASCAVNVEAAVVAVESVTLSQNAITLTEGDSATLTAAVKPDNATDKKCNVGGRAQRHSHGYRRRNSGRKRGQVHRDRDGGRGERELRGEC